MYKSADYLDKLQRYFAFDRQELNGIVVSILLLGLIVGFNDGRPVFELGHWVFNFINSIIIVTLAVLVHHTAQRLLGIYMGFRVQHRLWFYGLAIGLFLAVLTNGAVIFIGSSAIMLTVLERHRLGYFRDGLSYWANGWISLVGPLANILMALILKFMVFLPNNALIEKAIVVNIALAISQMLPIPHLDGANVFFASRLVYMFSFGSIIGISLMLLFVKQVAFVTAITSVVLFGLLFAAFYFKFLEEKI